MPENVSDATRPNAGRIYDYLLGGFHNFEVDRQAAEQLLKLLPFAGKAAKLQRWCLRDIARELSEHRGYNIIIDFASGLPTEDHLHKSVRPGTIVIYSDRDPVTVEYAREILEGVENTFAFQADACHPEELLNLAPVQKILNGRRDVAFVVWGVSAFIPPDDLKHLSQYLYEWSAPNSCLVFHAQAADVTPEAEARAQVRDLYRQMEAGSARHTLAEYAEWVKPWHPDANGFMSLLKWHGFDETMMSEEDRKVWGPGGVGYGAYLVK